MNSWEGCFLMQKMFLNGSVIQLSRYVEEKVNDMYKISVDLGVTSIEVV